MQSTIRIKGIDRLQRQLTGIAREQLPFALSVATNRTMSGCHTALVKEIRDVFHRPTPAVQRGVRWTATTKRNLSGKVYLSTGGGAYGGLDASAILAPHVTGEDRIVKASEIRLRRTGWMGQGQWLVPGAGVKLDRYGNITGPLMRQILAALAAFREGGYNKQRGAVGKIYGIPFVGVFKRTGKNSSVPLLHFTYKKPRYTAGKFDFYFVVQNYFKDHFSENFRRAWAGALRTAR